MTISIFDTATISLTGTIPTGTTLDIWHGSDSFSSNGDNLYNELYALSAAEVKVSDFIHASDTHEVHAWQVLNDGSLTKWTRGTDESSSGRHEDLDADILMVAVPPGGSVPTPTSSSGPPAPGTSQRLVRVKIRKQGDTPLR